MVFVLLCAGSLFVPEHVSAVDWVVAFVLTAGGIAGFHFPVHVATHMKLQPTAPALFIAVITLSPLFAAA